MEARETEGEGMWKETNKLLSLNANRRFQFASGHSLLLLPAKQSHWIIIQQMFRPTFSLTSRKNGTLRKCWELLSSSFRGAPSFPFSQPHPRNIWAGFYCLMFYCGGQSLTTFSPVLLLFIPRRQLLPYSIAQFPSIRVVPFFHSHPCIAKSTTKGETFTMWSVCMFSPHSLAPVLGQH